MPPPGNGAPRRRPTASNAAAPAARKPVRRAAPKASPSKLVVTTGVSEGQEFVLEGDELVLGRSSENAISVPDTSMSRKHALIRKTADGWAISDLGSGNGTIVNGEVIAEEHELQPDDVITVGDSEFTYVSGAGGAAAGPTPDANDTLRPSSGGGAIAPVANRRPPVRTSRQGGGRPVRASRGREAAVEATGKGRKLLAVVAVLALLVVVAGVGLKAIKDKQLEKERIAHQGEGEKTEAFKLALQEAKNLVRQAKYTEARDKLNEIKDADPNFEAQSVTNYLATVEKEIPNQAAIAEAQRAIKDAKLSAAIAAVKKVSANTLREADVTAIKAQIETLYNTRTGEARALLANQNDVAKMEQLKALADELTAARPDDPTGADFKKLAEQAIYRLKNPAAAAPGTPETPWVEVQTRFRNGDSSGALSLAQACAAKQPQCRALEGQIKEFEAKNKNLESLGAADLGSLFELDRKISGGQSSEQSKPLRTRLVATFFIDASRAKTSGNWSRAIELSRKVLQADPSHTGAAALIAEARGQAREIYLRGYQLKDSDPEGAVKMFKDVMTMTPKDDEYHQKAEARMAELQKQ